MLAQSCSVARRAQQSLSLRCHLNMSTCHGKLCSFSSHNPQISPAFSSENPSDFSGNDVLSRTLVRLRLPTGFKYFSADPQKSSKSHDNDFSEFVSKELNEGNGFKHGSEVEILSQAESESVQTETVALLFKEAIGLEKRSESKRLELEFKGLVDLTPEEQVKKLKSKLESQWEMINTLRDCIDDLRSTVKDLNSKNALLENSKDLITQSSLEFKKSSIGKSDRISEGSPHPKESVKSDEKKESVKFELKMPIMKKKAEGDSGSLEHPWPEWVQFVEHLNERGYLSKAVNFEDGPVDLQGLTTGKIYGFIKLAALNYVEDHAEILKSLSRSHLRKVALFRCPSHEKRVIIAVKRLRTFISSREDIDCPPSDLENTCNGLSVKLRLDDVVRLLCTYGLIAEKSELLIPDDVKQSIVNLLVEIIDFSSCSGNVEQGLL